MPADVPFPANCFCYYSIFLNFLLLFATKLGLEVSDSPHNALFDNKVTLSECIFSNVRFADAASACAERWETFKGGRWRRTKTPRLKVKLYFRVLIQLIPCRATAARITRYWPPRVHLKSMVDGGVRSLALKRASPSRCSVEGRAETRPLARQRAIHAPEFTALIDVVAYGQYTSFIFRLSK